MPFGNRFLVHPKLFGQHRFLGRLAAPHGAFHQVPRLIPANAQERCRVLDVGGTQHVDRQGLEHLRETTAFFCPRQSHLSNPVIVAIDSRRGRVQVSHELAAIQMAPRALGKVIVNRAVGAALRAGKAGSFRMFDVHINVLFRHIKLNPFHSPWRAQAEQMLVQILAFHRAPPWVDLRDSVLLTHKKV